MNRNIQILFFLVLGLLLLLGCKKDQKKAISWSFFEIPSSIDLTSVKMESCDKWHITGGESWHKGVYLQITNQIDLETNDSLTPKRLNAICLDDQNNLYSVGYTGYFMTKMVGSTWKTNHLFDNLQVLRDIDFLNDSTGIAVAGVSYHNGFLFRIGKDQHTFQIDTVHEELRAVEVISDSNAIAVGYGAIYKLQSDNQWERLDYFGDFFIDVDFPTPKIGYIIGNAGSILKTIDGGNTWDYLRKKNTYSSDHAYRALCFVDEQRGYITGEHGLLWKTTDGGENWTVGTGLPNVEFLDIDVCEDLGILVGKGGEIVTFDPQF